MVRFRRMRSLQKLASVHASVSNHFNSQRSLSSRANFKLNRATALAEWRCLFAAQAKASLSKLRRVQICLTAPLVSPSLLDPEPKRKTRRENKR